MQTPYDADYFLNGVASGKSNYVDYRWQEGPTMALAQRVIEVIGIKPGEVFMDFGCARGYLVKALRRLGVKAYGHDISEWAIQNCDPEVRDYVSTNPASLPQHHVWSKDTLEHLHPYEAVEAIGRFTKLAEKSILIIVPLCAEMNGRYVRDEDEFDKTHVTRATLEWWLTVAQGECGSKWFAQGSFHIPGLKPTSLSHPKSCGFITLRRI